MFVPVKTTTATRGDDSGVVVRYDKVSGETIVRFSQLRPVTNIGEKHYQLLVIKLKQEFGSDLVRAEELQ